MKIILEGMDASGKSTLATVLSQSLGRPIVGSEGPPKHIGEMNQRCHRYLGMSDVIFDRFPAISNPIYDHGRREEGLQVDKIDQYIIDELYRQKPFFIYCDLGERGLTHHQPVAGIDTPDHLRMINRFQGQLLTLYREWAVEHAHVIYRIGDDMSRVVKMTEAAVSK